MLYFARRMCRELLPSPAYRSNTGKPTMRSKKLYFATKTGFTIFVIFLLPSVVVPTPSPAQTFKVLHIFHGPNGEGPTGQLARDKAGNLYGTTQAGGAGKCQGSFDNTCGTAFMLDKTGKQVWLHSFNGKNGFGPLAGLIRGPGGNLYGTTYLGGDTNRYALGCGTVFKLHANGTEKLLYQFPGTPDGWFPKGPLARDAAGNLYGTTQQGGAFGSGYGTIYKVDKTDTETVLYSFTGGLDGCSPTGVVLDAAGNLLGATGGGGDPGNCTGYGVIFKLDPEGNFTVLHSFGGGDGSGPGPLILDLQGNLYGTTQEGGAGDLCLGGCGTVFELSPNRDGTWTETLLYSFCSLESCADGREPLAGLVRDDNGNLYGTTAFGGTSPCSGSGCGVVFEVGSGGTETVIHSFTGGRGGSQPSGALVQSPAGVLYGVATGGGDTKCFPPEGCGLVFRLTP